MYEHTIRIIAIVLVFLGVSTTVSRAEAEWGCYDPKPGHPTQEERRAFVARLRPVATEVEAQYGTPRAGILAMSVQESGYGFTRTAINANNLFGWKYGNAAHQAGLPSWTLGCQPASDPGKNYAVFPKFEDSMRFVARQLAQQERYAADTAAARKAKEAGEPEEARTENWLRAIQRAGYNPNPHYPDDVLKSGKEADVFSSWPNVATIAGNAPAPSSGVASKPLTADVEKVLGWMRRDNAGRYMITGADCKSEPSSNWAGYEALPAGSLQRCLYTVTSCANLAKAHLATCEAHRQYVGPKSATVILLEPGLERYATWIASACAEAEGNKEGCLNAVYEDGVGAGNWQIPVAGIVYEDLESNNYVQFGYAFRDGLTVRADSTCGWKNGSKGEDPPPAEQDAACSRPNATPAGVSNKARPMSSATRSELVAWRTDYATRAPKHEESYPITGEAAEAWRQFVRETLVAACSADGNPFVTARAVALHRKGRF